MTSLRVIVALLLAPGLAAAEVCEIQGQDVTLTSVVVRPQGAAPFELDVAKVAAVARLAGRDVRLDVTGAIAFTASAGPDIWYSATTAADDGMVRLLRGANVIGQRAEGSTLIGKAVLHASDVMQGERKEPDALVESVRVACDRLSLDWFAADVDPALGGDGTSWTSRGSALQLFASPSERAASVTVRAPSCEGKGCINVETIARKGAWLKVGASNENAAVVGWIRAKKLERVPSDTLVGYSYGCYGDHGSTNVFGIMRGPQPQPARIKRGTMLHAEAKLGPWARVVIEDGYQVRYTPGDTWAQVTQLPGIELKTGAAWVPVAALLPAAP